MFEHAPALLNHSLNLQTDTKSHGKKSVPPKMHDAYNRLTSFYGKTVIQQNSKPIFNLVKDFSDARSWAVAGFYNNTSGYALEKNCVVCVGCGESFQLHSYEQNVTPEEIITSHEPQDCTRMDIVKQSEEQLNAILGPTTSTDAPKTPKVPKAP